MFKFYAKLVIMMFAGGFITFTATAQSYTITQQVISAGGNSVTLQAKNIAFTIGEPAILTLSNADKTRTLTQGFHQPETSIMMVGIPNSVTILRDWGIQVFPNPTKEGLFIRQLTATDGLELHADVLDARGLSVLSTATLTNLSNEYIPCSELTAGYYVLRLHAQKEHKTVLIPFIKIK